MIRTLLRPILDSTPKQWIAAARRFAQPSAHLSLIQWLRMRFLPRFREATVPFLGGRFHLVDSASFLYTYQELFAHEIYRFASMNPRPRILDCGANIGLSVLYFKRLFPQAEITAFEPDPKIFACLARNVEAYAFSDVALVPKAVWTQETTLTFSQEGADGGHLSESKEGKVVIAVQTVRLRDYLKGKIDLLKIDIEGAECAVLEDCRDCLRDVERLFVEYHGFRRHPQDLQSVLTILSTAGFRYTIQSIGTVPVQPFISHEAPGGMEMQTVPSSQPSPPSPAPMNPKSVPKWV